MSVYTEIDTPKLTQLCSQFGVQASNIEPILAGVQNSNWFIYTDSDKAYVLTLFENVSIEEVKSLTVLMKAFDSIEIPVAVPLDHETGLSYTEYQGKAVQLYPRLAGEHPSETSAFMCEDMGRVLANIHDQLGSISANDDIKIIEKPVDWEARRDAFLPSLSLDEKKLMYKVWQKYTAATVGKDYSSLPSGLIHADLFFDNTLWQDDELTGVLDFTEVRDDFLLMDIAITANDFCTDWEDMTFDEDKLDYFLKGYGSVRDLSQDEEASLPVFLAMAAVYFWLFRLNMIDKNKQDNRHGDMVTVKSPELMKNLVKIHAAKL